MYVARDEDGHLWLYEKKPIKKPEYWVCVGGYCQVLDPDLFPEVEWEDEEPRKLILKPIKEELGFVNLYKDGGQVKVGWKIFPTKKEAEENFKDDEKYITTANIQWRDSNDNL